LRYLLAPVARAADVETITNLRPKRIGRPPQIGRFLFESDI